MNHEILRLIETKMGRAVTNSRAVAEYFDKRHDHVLRDIDNILASISGTPDLGSLFVQREDYHEQARKMVRSFDMTKDGFTLLPMGFTGPRALRFKLAYIARFNAMEEELRTHHRAAYFGGVIVKEFHLNGLSFEGVHVDSKGETPHPSISPRERS